MDPAALENLDPAVPSPGDAYRWLPTMSVQPGMVTARPVVGLFDARETMYVAVGSTITANTIAQMVAKGVECVAVFDVSARAELDGKALGTPFVKRLDEIFGPSPDAACMALRDALIAAEPTFR